MNRKVRVLVVDDSSFFRSRISRALEEGGDIEVVGQAGNGREALELNRRLRPDLITMDVEMPVMDGITAVRRITAERRTPIIMFSALTREGARATLDALDAGAVDFLPKNPESANGQHAAQLLRDRVLGIAAHRVAGNLPRAAAPRTAAAHAGPRPRLVLLGASTGGPVALQQVLMALPASFPVPVLVAVHMPAAFTPTFAERLDQLCALRVREARDGDPLQPGTALVAPGGHQTLVEGRAGRLRVAVRDDGSQLYKPSVDLVLGSAARILGRELLGVVLTGMGADGREGARLLKDAGGALWSQDHASCVVYGMPQAVEKAGLSDRVLPLAEIGPSLVQAV